MANKIRIIGDFGEEVVQAVEELVSGLKGVQTTQVLVQGQDVFPHPDEEAHAAEHAPPEQQEPTAPEGTGAPETAATEAPPTETWDGQDRRTGPEDRRGEQVTA